MAQLRQARTGEDRLQVGDLAVAAVVGGAQPQVEMLEGGQVAGAHAADHRGGQSTGLRLQAAQPLMAQGVNSSPLPPRTPNSSSAG